MTDGAHTLIETLLEAGVDTCFANPGTSEMHFVSAVDAYPEMQGVLCLFEGVATGAADGYARMMRKPAVTLLHLGPGLANGLANLHNAKKAQTPVVNVIGDHATFHKPLDAPLNSDVEGTAAPYSHHVHTTHSAETVAPDTARAVAEARNNGGQIASLILPADAAWSPAPGKAAPRDPEPRAQVPDTRINAATALLHNGNRTGLILGAEACFGDGLTLAERLSTATGATLLMPYSSPRVERGRTRVPATRIPFPVDMAVSVLAEFEQLILIGSHEPVAFFAYPGLPSKICPPEADLLDLCHPTADVVDTLDRLCQATNAPDQARIPAPPDLPPAPSGPLTPESFADVVARALREDMILVDEGITSSRALFGKTCSSSRHDLLVNVGGSIGDGLPLALGAAIACPDRPVLSLNGDGSAAYTVQALWSMARYNTNITTVICANRTYAILKGEMVRVGAMPPGSNVRHDLLDIDRPTIDWVALAQGFGVPATRVDSAEGLAAELERGFDTPGPRLIEAVL